MSGASEKVPAKELHGRYINRSSGGYVFVGHHPKHPDDTGVVFCNEEGSVTSFRLSAEAVAALVALLTNPDAGEAGSPPVPRRKEVFAWTLVEPPQQSGDGK
jgi:hypothetical protein